MGIFTNWFKKKEPEQETHYGSSVESPRFLPFSFEELQKRSLLRRNCTEVGLSGLCAPLTHCEGFLRKFWISERLSSMRLKGSLAGKV